MTTQEGTPATEAPAQPYAAPTAPTETGNPPKPRYLHPQLPVWKLVLLIIATLGLYQLRWVYRSAKELDRLGRERTIPWLWIFAFAGPLVAAIALTRMGGFHARWEREVTGSSSGGWVTLVAVLATIAGQIVVFATDHTLQTFYLLLLGVFVLPALSLGLLQQRLNRIKLALDEADFHYSGARFTPAQWVALVPGVPIALAFLALLFWTEMGLDGADRISSGTAITIGDDVKLRVRDGEWYQVPPGYLGDDTELEIVSRDLMSWALVYRDSSTVTEVVDFRSDAIAQEDTISECRSRVDVDDSLRSAGEVVCNGSAVLSSSIMYVTRVVETPNGSVEIVTYGEATGASESRKLRERLNTLANGLEWIE